MTEFVTDGHLGGYIAGGDPATYYPELWSWIIEDQKIESVLDIGCGEGHALDYFKSLGVKAWGVDGLNKRRRDDILVRDFTKHGYFLNHPYDLVWCCEVAEHIEEKFLPHFLKWLEQGKLILMTHAEPGQLGHHHVNCQPSSYWIGAMAARGYLLDHDLTSLARGMAGVNTDPNNHFKRSGLAFRRW